MSRSSLPNAAGRPTSLRLLQFNHLNVQSTACSLKRKIALSRSEVAKYFAMCRCLTKRERGFLFHIFLRKTTCEGENNTASFAGTIYAHLVQRDNAHAKKP